MIKLFCDLCGKLVDPPVRSGSIFRPVSKSVGIVIGFKVELCREGSVVGTSNLPDLCPECAASMLMELAREVRGICCHGDELKEQG